MVRSKQAGEQMRAESRQKLLSAARQVFAGQGYFNSKISDIAQAAGMSQGNLYWYFPSKEALLQAVLDQGFAGIEAVLVEARQYSGNGRARIDHLIEGFVEFGRQQGEFTTIFLSLLGHGGVPLLSRLGFDTLEIGKHYHQHLSAIFSEAQAEGAILDLDPDLLVVFFFSFFNGLWMTYNRDWTDLVPPEAIHQAILRLLGSGPAQGGDR
ncbi:MAG TPA: TetR/AcrR family transcriptional regulator [Anaerolineales bacterium]|nr:TetR/AcrR family transcriptional regulator [Anaerolineales bacterium]